MGAGLLSKTVFAIAAGTAPRRPQDDSLATYAPPLSREEAPIDWTRPVAAVVRHIYGMQPWPVATAELGGTAFRIFAARETPRPEGAAAVPPEPGTVVSADKRGIEVVCGDGGRLLITELQAAGGRRMQAGAWLLGHPFPVD